MEQLPASQTIAEIIDSLEMAGPVEPQRLKNAETLVKHQKKELKRKYRNDVKQKAPVVHGLHVDVGKHFLGRAKVSVAFDNLNGDGPRITYSRLQRETAQSEVRRLISLGGEDGRTLYREDPAYELIIVVGEADIIPTSLTTATTGPFPTAKFAHSAKDHDCEVEDGKLRIECIRKLYEPLLKKLDEADEEVTKAARDKSRLTRLEAAAYRIEQEVLSKVVWLAAFYNADTIEEDLNARQAIYLKLATNCVNKAKPNQPGHHFRQITSSLSRSVSPKDREAINGLALTLEPNTKSNVRRLLKRFSDVVFVFTFLHRFNTFYNYLFDPRKLVNAKHTVWGIILPFINGNIKIIQFLASSQPIPLEEGEKLGRNNAQEITARILSNLESSNEGLDVRIADIIFKIVAFQFRTHLQGSMDYFGTSSEQWSRNFKEYSSNVKESIQRRVERELGRSGIWGNGQKRILTALPAKINAILNFQLFSGPNGVPSLDRKVPLLCPEFLDQLLDCCLTVEPVIKMMCSWIVPNLKDYHEQRVSPKAEVLNESKAFKSDFELLLDSFTYFIGFEKKGDGWEKTTVGEMLEKTLPGAGRPCKEIVRELEDEVISLIFRERHRVLIPLIAPVQTMLDTESKVWSAPHLKHVLQGEMPHVLFQVNAWAKQRINRPDNPPLPLVRQTAPYPTQQLLDLVKTSTSVWSKVISGLVASTFDWAVQNKNGSDIRARFLTNLLEESLHYTQAHKPLLATHPKLRAFHDKFIQTITGKPGMTDIPCWRTFTASTPTSSDTSSDTFEDDLVKDNKALSRSAEYDQTLNMVFKRLLKSLARPGILGVPVEKGSKRYAIHPGAAKCLKELRKISVQMQADCKAIHLQTPNPTLFCRGPFDIDFPGEDAGLNWNIATNNQLGIYYSTANKGVKESDTKEKSKEESSGEESGEEASGKELEEEASGMESEEEASGKESEEEASGKESEEEASGESGSETSVSVEIMPPNQRQLSSVKPALSQLGIDPTPDPSNRGQLTLPPVKASNFEARSQSSSPTPAGAKRPGSSSLAKGLGKRQKVVTGEVASDEIEYWGDDDDLPEGFMEEVCMDKSLK